MLPQAKKRVFPVCAITDTLAITATLKSTNVKSTRLAPKEAPVTIRLAVTLVYALQNYQHPVNKKISKFVTRTTTFV